jgi:hypothetical protein
LATIQKPVCGKDQIRRSLILGRSDINGIDYLEVDPAQHTVLTVYFINSVPPVDAAHPADDLYGVSKDLSKIAITGGTRIVGIRPVKASRNSDGSITITVSDGGDYSTYTLALNVPALDILFSQIDFSFMAACPSDFDCRITTTCPPLQLPELLLDYEAKDYGSFRQLLLNLLPQLNPNFRETNPSDLGIALVELLAYGGDRLSYFQDAVANEAYLDTIRHRISARRVAKLIDYRMHDGRNAWAYVHVAVTAGVGLPLGTKIVSRITMPLLEQTAPPGPAIRSAQITADSMQSDPALASVVAFETTFPIALDPANNLIYIHTFGNRDCCLAAGTTEAFLFTVPAGSNTATVPALNQNDFLLLEEVLGPQTGLAPDADPKHRQIVRINAPTDSGYSDPLFNNQVQNGVPQPWQAGNTPLPLLRVQWGTADKLTFPLCVSGTLADGAEINNISMARGNIVLADHGLTTTEKFSLAGPVTDTPPFRPRLSHGPLTMEIQDGSLIYDSMSGRLSTPLTDLTGDVTQAKPAISLFATFPSGTDLWTPATDLLEATPFDEFFVPEIDNDLTAVLRFGDDEYGRSIAGATTIQVNHRIGNGVAGNVGAESLAHVAPEAVIGGGIIQLVRNPLPAQDGVDPETIESVQQWAPEAFRTVQYRAVIEADYARVAELLPEVQSAVASFRWTGSWYTVFVGILPSSPSDLTNQADGVMELSASLQHAVLAFLDGYRIAGYDLEIRPPQLVALEIDLLVCAGSDFFESDVQQAVEDALSDKLLPDGTKGFFYPGNFVFGQPVYLSQIYAVVQAIQGVDSLVVTQFVRYGQPDNGELASGIMPIGPWQIAQLDNDPNFMEHGVLKVSMRGGKL